MLEMRVQGICRCPSHPMLAIVLRKSGATRLLAIGIPAEEAERIAHEMRRTPQCQPSIYTLARHILAITADPKQIVPWLDIRDGTLMGGVEFVRGDLRISLECAPRDVAVLAAQWAMPVRIQDALAADLEQKDGTVLAHDAEPADLTGWLDRVRPEDFG